MRMCKGVCCISLFVLYSEQGILGLESGATLRSPLDSLGFTLNKNHSNKSGNLGGTLYPWMFLLEKYASLFRVEGILMPQIYVMVCFHVDSYVKGVHLKNLTPIHVDLLFFKTHTLLFFSVFETSGDTWQVPSRVSWEKRINQNFWSRSLPMLTDFYFSREPLVLVPTIFF